MFKNISFWCGVLFFVVAMIIHHILSEQPLVEGAQVDMNDVSKLKITLKGPQKFVEKIFQKPPQGSEENLEENETNGVVVQVNAERGGENGDVVQPGDVDENSEVVQSGNPGCGSDRGLVQKDAINHTEGCSRLANSDSSDGGESLCNSSFEKLETGTFRKCIWNSEDNSCSTETEECVPEMAGNTDIPYCASSVWQPGPHLGVTGGEENPTLPYCYCRDGETGTNHTTTDVGQVSRCLVDNRVDGGRLPEWMNSGRLPVQSGDAVDSAAAATAAAAAAASQATRLSTGACETPITTNEECIAAATAQGFDPPMWDSSPSENDNYPTGCSIPYGTKAHFNARTTQVECGGGTADADCLCAA